MQFIGHIVVCLISVTIAIVLPAQPLDSVHVFKSLPVATYTTSAANALAWRSHQEHAEHITIKGPKLISANDALSSYKKTPLMQGRITDLTHVAMAFSGGRPVAFGVSEDLGRILNFTARTEYRISGMADHMRVRALLAKMLLEL